MGIWEPLLFWIFAAGALITSSAVIVLRNPLYCAMALIVDFFFFAGLYVLLSAHFMAIVQVLVYGGAIMVLFLFIIMLLNLRDEDLGETRFSLHHAVAVLGGLAMFFFIGTAISLVVDKGAVAEGRTQAAIVAQADEEGTQAVLIQTPSRVPGLYADLNEDALEAGFKARLRSFEEGTATPADGKYRPFDPNQPFEVPPSLRHQEDRIGTVPGRTGLYGTTQPISVLLVNRFVIPFELTAILLLAAIIGAMIIAKRRVA
ncbi:MAG: NADH-quinone oxidoreductase subunit J [Bradymonadaceae bacterium]|nr:NADH-quinone oxidoreductase subunit J [Lujinxingiaceae bacterium]